MRNNVVADAPGRVNLIGEHTDYHQGYVLPTVIPQRSRARVSRRADGRVHAFSRETGEAREYTIGAETPTQTWIDYVQGLTCVLRSLTSELCGFDLLVESDVPVGSGLSSSAALTVSILRALRELNGLAYDDVELAQIAQRAENEFVGAPVGIMDPMACSVGRAGTALFLDTRSLAIQLVPLPSEAELVIIDSGVKHRHAGGGYVNRRRESFEAAAQMQVTTLRDATLDQLAASGMSDTLRRRARHIITENQRVLDTVAALTNGDLPRAGALFSASHLSMRDDYEVSTPEVDRLVELAQRHPDVYGARLTGGGFGGAVVMLVCAGAGTRVADEVLRGYGTTQRVILLQHE